MLALPRHACKDNFTIDLKGMDGRISCGLSGSGPGKTVGCITGGNSYLVIEGPKSFSEM